MDGKPAEGAESGATEGHGRWQELRDGRFLRPRLLELHLDGCWGLGWRAQELTSRAKSMLISVVSLVSSCSVTSVAVNLEVCRVFTSCTSSSREPVASFSSLEGSQEAHGWSGQGLVVPVSGPGEGGGKVSPKDLILQLLELFLASSDIDDERILLLLQLRTLLPDHNAQ